MFPSLLRHQAGSIMATALDYTVMIIFVSLVGVAPEVGTAIGAACGGAVNFYIGRRWIFRATHDRSAPQAGRYALVSFGSLLLNTAGVYAFAGPLDVHYVAVRAAVSLGVSLFWNFPMQRTFVFPGRARP